MPERALKERVIPLLAVVQEHERGFNEQVLPRLLEAYPLETVGQLHYFLVFWCQMGRAQLNKAVGEDTVNDLLALLSEYGIDPDKCHLERSDGDEETTIGPPPEWFQRRD